MDTTTVPGVGLDAEQQEFLRLFEAKYGKRNATRLRHTMYAPRVMPDSKRATGCWTSSKTANRSRGYIIFQQRGFGPRAFHRIVKELYGAPIKPNEHVHHECEVKGCFNPSHLAVVQDTEHPLLSSTSVAHHNARKAHCKNGHPLLPNPNDDGRYCPVCKKTGAALRYQLYKEERAANARVYRLSHADEITARAKAYYAKNREAILAKVHAWYEAHRDEVAVYKRAHAAAHRDELRAYNRIYREVHREELKAKQRAWREAHREEIAVKKHIYYTEHREKSLGKNHAYYAAHHDEVIAQHREYRAKLKLAKQSTAPTPGA